MERIVDEFTYRFVPFIPRLKLGVFGLQNAEAISTQLDELVEYYLSQGWEYVRLEQVSAVHAAGCLASLFGKTSHSMDYDLVVFRRSRALSEADTHPVERVGQSATGADLPSPSPTPSRPVPDAVKARYGEARARYDAWLALVGGDDPFIDEDELMHARDWFLEALDAVVEQCTREEAGVGAAVARRVQTDFSRMIGDSGIAIAVERLQSRA